MANTTPVAESAQFDAHLLKTALAPKLQCPCCLAGWFRERRERLGISDADASEAIGSVYELEAVEETGCISLYDRTAQLYRVPELLLRVWTGSVGPGAADEFVAFLQARTSAKAGKLNRVAGARTGSRVRA